MGTFPETTFKKVNRKINLKLIDETADIIGNMIQKVASEISLIIPKLPKVKSLRLPPGYFDQ